jgi:GGDEF domain-containing protein
MSMNVGPKLPDPEIPKLDVSMLGSDHASLREKFQEELRAVTDMAEYTDYVSIPSETLRRIGQLGAVLIWDHSQIETNSKLDYKSGVIGYETADFEVQRTVSDRRRQVERDSSLYEVPFAYYSFFDTDDFKKINTILGEPIADLLILDEGKSLSQSMQETRIGDFPMRHGGDEFGIWFNDLFADPESCNEVAQKNFEKIFNIARKLENDVNNGLLVPGRGITRSQIESIGRITFSFGFITPSLKDIDDFKGESEIPDSNALFALAAEQERLAKKDKTVTTIAVRGVVFDIYGNQLN